MNKDEIESDYMGAVHTLRRDIRDAEICQLDSVTLDLETASRVLRHADALHPIAPSESIISPGDLKIETWPIEGRHPQGGQHCGSGTAGIKITHLPSGIEALVETSRSQRINRMIALEMIETAITHPRFSL